MTQILQMTSQGLDRPSIKTMVSVTKSEFSTFLLVILIYAIVVYLLSAIKAIRDRIAMKAALKAKRDGTWKKQKTIRPKSLMRSILIIHDGGREERIKIGYPRFRGSVVYTKDGVKIRGRLSTTKGLSQSSAMGTTGSTVDVNVSPVEAAKFTKPVSPCGIATLPVLAEFPSESFGGTHESSVDMQEAANRNISNNSSCPFSYTEPGIQDEDNTAFSTLTSRSSDQGSLPGQIIGV